MVYRTGLVIASFFVEFSDILDHLSTYGDPLLLAADVNINFERALYTTTIEFIDLLECYGLVQHVTGATHDAGGTIDVVFTRCDLPPPTVDIVDVSLSDNRLLRWASRLHHSHPGYTPSTSRIWRSFDAAAFRISLSGSVLGDERHWNLHGDALVNLYDLRSVIFWISKLRFGASRTCHRRPSCVRLTMNAAEQTSRYVRWRETSIVLVATRPPVSRQFRLSEHSAASTSNCSVASVPSSGPPRQRRPVTTASPEAVVQRATRPWFRTHFRYCHYGPAPIRRQEGQ